MKKYACLILALSLCLALAVPAFADYQFMESNDWGDVYTLKIDREPISAVEPEDHWDTIVYTVDANTTFTFTRLPVAPFYKTNVMLYEGERDSINADRCYLINPKTGSADLSEGVGYPNNDEEAYNIPAGASFSFQLPAELKNKDALTLMIGFYNEGGSGEASYTIIPTGTPERASATTEAKPVVQLTAQKLTVNGEEKSTEIYNIDGSNYFKLRDVAMLLNGSGSQFSVAWDAASATISVTTGEAYTAVGGELDAGTDKSASAVQSAQKLMINGENVDLTAFNIGGNNFFKLRDLGTELGFEVTYDEATATVQITG